MLEMELISMYIICNCEDTPDDFKRWDVDAPMMIAFA